MQKAISRNLSGYVKNGITIGKYASIYTCKSTCKISKPKSTSEKKIQVKIAGKTREQVPSASLTSSTPARRTDSVPKVAIQKGSTKPCNGTSRLKLSALQTNKDDSRNISNNTDNNFSNITNNEHNNYNNTVDNVNNAPEKNADGNNDVPSLVPRSRLSTLVPTSIRPVAASSLSTSTHNELSKTSYGLNASHIKNGTVVTNLVTYANSVRDTVEEVLTAQQSSIESKLAEIASSLNVLPVLTQKIGILEAGRLSRNSAECAYQSVSGV